MGENYSAHLGGIIFARALRCTGTSRRGALKCPHRLCSCGHFALAFHQFPPVFQEAICVFFLFSIASGGWNDRLGRTDSLRGGPFVHRPWSFAGSFRLLAARRTKCEAIKYIKSVRGRNLHFREAAFLQQLDGWLIYIQQTRFGYFGSLSC